MNQATAPSELIFDVQGTLGRLGGDHGLLSELIEFCLADAPPLVADLHTAVAAGDHARIEKSSHALKGLVAGCGGVRAASAAQRMERAGRAGDLKDTSRLLADVADELQRFRQALIDYKKSNMPSP